MRLVIKYIYSVVNTYIRYKLESKYRKLMVENLGVNMFGDSVSRTQAPCSRLCEVQFN
jgi:hypothetical protein